MARKSLGRFRFFPSRGTVKMVVTHFVNEDGTKAMKSYLPQTRVAPFGTFESEAVATPSLALNAEPKKTPENRLISVTYGGTIAQPGRPNEDAMFVGRLVGDPLISSTRAYIFFPSFSTDGSICSVCPVIGSP